MGIKFSRNQKIEIVIVALAIILRVGYFWINMATHDNSLLGTIWKSESYYEIAHNILSGHGFSGATTEPYTPDSWRTPLYPLFIAANFKLFGSDLAVIISQIIMGSILALLAKRISYHIMNNEKIAVAKERTVSIPNCYKEKGRVRLKITRTKHNIFIGELM